MLSSRLFDLVMADGVALVDLEKRLPLDHRAGWLDLPVPGGGTQRGRIAAMRRDLARLRQGSRPQPTDLEAVPLLDHWSVRLDGNENLFALYGVIRRHPRIYDGRFATTSIVVAMDLQGLRWARTVSRFYLLGRPDGAKNSD
jgi:hypothetical protein